MDFGQSGELKTPPKKFKVTGHVTERNKMSKEDSKLSVELTMDEAQTILLALERESYAFMEGHQSTGEAFFLDSLKRTHNLIEMIRERIVQQDEQEAQTHKEDIARLQTLLGRQFI